MNLFSNHYKNLRSVIRNRHSVFRNRHSVFRNGHSEVRNAHSVSRNGDFSKANRVNASNFLSFNR